MERNLTRATLYLATAPAGATFSQRSLRKSLHCYMGPGRKTVEWSFCGPHVLEALNGNIKAPLGPVRGYRDLDCLLLKAQRLASPKTEVVAFQKARSSTDR